ncbi:molecular chaperone GrpE [Pustulibacterium marinum]|uniref:Protein GrpE n=1 Tax=Pustulibacterium marinum TaxID=1224947 RepID=A0A1I7FCX8_9FLAO|nr:nucleotide exchange factor GrpE [Pustulibacterium marinum]SFU34113.1 molecular chaperone GrpE [Pustulibacterium marinum]
MSKKDIEQNKAEVEEQTTDATQATENQNEAAEKEELSAEEKLKEELGKEKDKFLRLFAEFENYKRRTAKERVENMKSANKEVMLAMLPVLDDFDRALNELTKSEDKEMLKGVELIHGKFKNTLQQKGLEQVEAAAGESFDADIHDAITQIPAPTEDLKGKIVDVIEKGYKLGDKIIRHPKVVVGQ